MIPRAARPAPSARPKGQDARPTGAQQRAATATASRAERTRRLLEAPIGPTLARLAAPNIVAMLVMSATSVAEAWFAGRLGVSALAGLALVFPFVMLTQMLSNGAMGGAISAAVARALGAGETRRAERLVLHVWVLALGFALVSWALVSAFGEPLFRLLGGRGEGLEAALAYAHVYFAGCAAHWLCNTMLSVVRGTGNMLLPACVMMGVSAVLIPLAGALSLGWGPFPPLGMAGLAAAQVGAFGLGALVALACLASGRTGLSLGGAFGGLQGRLFGEILRVGLMASVSSIQTVLNIVVMVGVVGRFGEAALAGYGLGTRLEFLMVPVCFGIGAAMTAMVGASFGAGARERALHVAWTGSLAAAAIVGSVGLLCAAWPELWLGLFLGPGDAEAMAAGRSYFRIVGPFYAFFALGLAFYFASQGAARVFWPLVGAVVRLLVAAGGGLLAAVVFGAPLWAVFAAAAAGMLVYGTLIAASVRITEWR